MDLGVVLGVDSVRAAQRLRRLCRFAGGIVEPGRGLEPRTPSLPWSFDQVTVRFCGGVCGKFRAYAVQFPFL